MKKIILLFLVTCYCFNAVAQTASLVKDIYTGTTSSNSSLNYIQYNNIILFLANDGSHGEELWSTDGITGNTFLVKDICPGTTSSDPEYFYKFNNELYFRANNGANGYELWKTDGTSAGTIQVKDILPGSDGGLQSMAFEVVWQKNGYFYFIARNGSLLDRELWKSDGTASGTQLVKDICPGTTSSDPEYFYEFNNELYFRANNGANGYELWKTDGTTTGTIQVKDILPGSDGGLQSMAFEVVWQKNGYFYFIARNGSLLDRELWKSDGTASGTQLVKDICPGTTSSDPEYFYEFNTELYFRANNGANGYELWKTDGTTTGTIQVKDILPGSDGGLQSMAFEVVWQKNGYFYFIARNGSLLDRELWKSDGTVSGTQLVKDICPGTTSSDPEYFYEFNNELYFRANNGANGYELWKTDGTISGTNQVKDILPGSDGGLSSMALSIYFTYNGSFYFQAHTSTLGDREIWKSDGTANGTVLVQDIYSGANSSNPESFIMLPNDYIIFLAQDATNGKELWSFYLPGVTSVNEIPNNEFALYPNPIVSGGLINIKSNQSWKSDLVVNLFTVAGEIIHSRRIQNLNGNLETSFQIPELPSGVYILETILADKVRKTSRIIVLNK